METGKELGRGACATVFLSCLKLGSSALQMAVKTATLYASHDLKHEKAILDRLGCNCPHIVQCYGDDITSDIFGNQLYRVFLEYAPYGSLRDYLSSSIGTFSENDVRRHTKSMLEGLAYIHRNKLVHCDIKPQNVLLRSASELMVADFGLAKPFGKKAEEFPVRGKKAGGFPVRGTPLYVAPEGVLCGQLEAPADIWSLGCTVIEMFTGKPARTVPKWMDKSDILDCIAFGGAMPKIPQRLSEQGKDFLAKCLTVEPTERWTAEMLLKHPFITGDNELIIMQRSRLTYCQSKKERFTSQNFASGQERLGISRGDTAGFVYSTDLPIVPTGWGD